MEGNAELGWGRSKVCPSQWPKLLGRRAQATGETGPTIGKALVELSGGIGGRGCGKMEGLIIRRLVWRLDACAKIIIYKD